MIEEDVVMIESSSNVGIEYEILGDYVNVRNQRCENEVNDESLMDNRIDSVDDLPESQMLDSEVVLVSVDGKILKAPISSLERNLENAQLRSPQYQLSPDEGTEFCEGNLDFRKGDKNVDVHDVGDLDTPGHKIVSEDVQEVKSGTNEIQSESKCKKGYEVDDCKDQETLVNEGNQEMKRSIGGDADSASTGLKKGDVWALYRNWSHSWNSDTTEEEKHKNDVVEVLEDYTEENGVKIVPLGKVAGFKSVFTQHSDPKEVRTLPKEEIFRFSHQVSSYVLTDQEAPNIPNGFRELDPAALPLELLQVIN